MAVRTGSPLLERERELRRIDDLLDSAQTGTGGLLLIVGAAGIGKTSLLEQCARGAAARGMVVLRARGDELVVELPFAGVRELLAGELREGALDGAAALAAPVFDAHAASGLDAERASSVLHGLHWLVANLADRGSLVLLVDDAHWLDAPSARFLAYLARRVDSLPVLLVVAARRGEAPDPVGPIAVLSEVAGDVLVPPALSEAGAATIVRRELGARVDDRLCRTCHEATAGNPFYLRELLAALRTGGGRPSLETTEYVQTLGAGAVGRSVLVRLARLGADCERLAQAVAVLESGAPLRRAATLAGLDRPHAEAAADRMREADVLAASQALSFVHPIVREAIAAELPPSRRAALHLEAARLLAGEEAPADQIAAHLLSAEPLGQPWVVDRLRHAARRALSQGAPDVAVSYLRRALAEPPTAEARLELLLELGRAEALMPVNHDLPALREALTLADDALQRAEVALELAWALTPLGRFCEVACLLEDSLTFDGELPAAVVGRREALLLGAGGPCLAAASRLRQRAAGYLERAERGEIGDPLMLAALAQTFGVAGLPAARMARLAARALEDKRLTDFPPAYIGAAVAMAWADEFEMAARAQDAGIAEAQRRGSAPLFMHISCFRGETALRAGNLKDAEGHLRSALPLARELGADHFAVMFFIPVLLELGRILEAATLLSSVALTDSEPSNWQGVIVLAHRGRVRILEGQSEAGLADLLGAHERMIAAGCDLSVLCDWLPAAAGTLSRLGRRNEATALAERELQEASAFGAPRRLGIALSTCGMLDPGDRGLMLLRDAVAQLEDSGARLEHARALVNLGIGVHARGDREQAREPLSRGLDLAHRCGAVALAEQARTELVRTGARPRRRTLSGPESLTPAELRTARMAAQGLSNREIAQALFVSAKTVEWQLSHAYAKLQIGGRRELASALSAEIPG